MAKSSEKLHVTWLATDKLIPYINNPKAHPPEQVDQIAASIQAFGFNDPIAIDGENTIIEGHGRLLAAQKLGLKTLPVVQLTHLSDAEQKAYALAHNKLTLNSGWDLALLRLEFEQLQELDLDELTLTGFRPEEVSALFSPVSIPDSEPELDITPEREGQTKQVTCPACQTTFAV
jgi:ParB family chromosome partitioning protein